MSASTRGRATARPERGGKAAAAPPLEYSLLLTATLCLLAFGAVMVFSASSARSLLNSGGSGFYYLERTLIYAAIGLLAMRVAAVRGVAAIQTLTPLIVVGSMVLLFAVLLPGIGHQANGAQRWVGAGMLQFQPSELAKIAIVIFLASYLRDNRQILVTAGRRVLGVTIPPMKQFGPMLIVWGAAMGTLLITRELGTSLMFFGAFLALLYVATGRLSFPLIGLGAFALGAWYLAGHVSHVHARVLAWEHPFDPSLYSRPFGGSYQLAQSLFAQADGGLLGRGFDQSLLRGAHDGPSILPVPESDMIYAVIVNELGLVGGMALLGVYLLFIARGLKTAVLARDSFSKLLATGLSFVLALQVFVIVGGVTRVIPLTGVTLPFVAYGGSSVVMNFVLVALLLVVSDRARRPYESSRRAPPRR